MKTKVYVIKRELEESDKDVVLRTLKMVPLADIIKPSEKKVLINPNWVFDEHYKEGNITSTESVEGLVIYLINDVNISPERIIVADGGQYSSDSDVMKTNDVFRLEEYGIKVYNLNSDKRIDDVKPTNALALKTVNIAKTAMDASCIISVPSLKTTVIPDKPVLEMERTSSTSGRLYITASIGKVISCSTSSEARPGASVLTVT